MGSLRIELRYALRERVLVGTLIVTFLLSTFAVLSGYFATAAWTAENQRLIDASEAEQRHALSHQSDAGGAAYYVHHLTYAPPGPLAFAAPGTIEDLPWRHRIRMLALEGQIYESDTGNPALSGIGRLDFTFLASVLLPLVLILLLYDLDARERREGRYELLQATSAEGPRTLLYRAVARTLLLWASALVPFLLLAPGAGVSASLIASVLLVSAAHLVFWLIVCRLASSRTADGSTAATLLLAVWLVVTAAVPTAGRFLVERAVPVPAGGEILLKQREAVNDAWDLPKEATMEPFAAMHPEWRAHIEVTQPFDWKWYYAFQQMGDASVRLESDALREGVARRNSLMSWVALLSPPLAVERRLTHLAGTDRAHHQAYMRCVRKFHAELRAFHYPMLFGTREYSLEAMADLPRYEPCDV
jgi:ABC-2 type transport system permease protein